MEHSARRGPAFAALAALAAAAVPAGAGWVMPGQAQAEQGRFGQAKVEQAAPAPADALVAEVVVRRAGQECFASLVHAFGYLVPRASAVVMFNAPDFKITDVRAKVGDAVRRGDVVALAAPAGRPAGGQGGQGAQQAGQAAQAGQAGQAGQAEVPIKSLAAGTVLQATAFKGELMSAKSPPLFTLAVDGEIEAAVAVPSLHVGALSAGQAVHLQARDGTTYNGHIRLMPALVDPASQMGEVRVSLDGDAHPPPGRFLRATVEASRSCNIGVPRAALRRTAGGMQVEVVEDGTVLTRPVRVGLTNESDAEIVSGLKAGDLVIANAGSSLRAGDHVHAILPDLRDAR